MLVLSNQSALRFMAADWDSDAALMLSIPEACQIAFHNGLGLSSLKIRLWPVLQADCSALYHEAQAAQQ